MGSGSWTTEAFTSYSTTMHRSVLDDGSVDIKSKTADQIFQVHRLHDDLNPYKVIRECRDSEEHPNTIPVILALDVTGSMGETAVEVAAELNKIMTNLYESVTDVEFMIMGIGDLSYDKSPIQATQFESDIRIAEQLDKIYFEFGGGGNDWESYTAAWAFALTQTDLDCWKRGKKGIIITMGDEELNPYLPASKYAAATGHGNSEFKGNHDIETADLYELVKDRFDIYHIDVNHRRFRPNLAGFKNTLGEDHVVSVPVNGVAQAITNIVKNSASEGVTFATGDAVSGETLSQIIGEISW